MRIFFTKRFYGFLVLLIVAFLIGYYFTFVFLFAKLGVGLMAGFLLFEITILFATKGNLAAERTCSGRFSNGDENEVHIRIQNRFGFKVELQVFDELPYLFQRRDLFFRLSMPANSERQITYSLRPTMRGSYSFGHVILLVSTPLGLVRRKLKSGEEKEVRVYPSFIRIHKYELMAISQNLTLQGQKQVRRVGTSKEFDTIKDYVWGDDPRNINWSATARRGHLMTNHYIDERAQHIICVLDKSRSMKMPFEGLTLLDYAINASLVISDVSLKKGDRAGLLSFENKVDSFVQPGNKNTQLYQIMEALYNQDTSFREPDFASLFAFCNKNIRQRSLLLIFTNFESIHSLRRQMSFLKMLNRKHLVVLVYFRNTEVDFLLKEEASTTRKIYNQAIGYQMLEEKLLIRDELHRNNILSLYTTPRNLSVDVINKYIEIKTKRMI